MRGRVYKVKNFRTTQKYYTRERTYYKGAYN